MKINWSEFRKGFVSVWAHGYTVTLLSAASIVLFAMWWFQ